MFKVLFITLLVIILLILIVFLPRILKDVKLKKDKKNIYAIKNVKTGLCIRPYNADFKEDNKIIMYPLKNWECITWQFIKLQDNKYLLQNLYTHKTLVPRKFEESTTFYQKTLGTNENQIYEVIKASDYYLIKIADTELYLTSLSNETNSNLILQELNNEDNQKWELIKQNPII